MYEGTGPRVTEDTPNGFRAGRDTLNWNDIKWLRDRWPGKLLIKGVMRPEDAQAAARLGVDALIVSNHGGRQFDAAVSTLQALPVFIDGGFRRGTDVIKALALGVHMVFLGRPPLYDAAVKGAAGIRRVLELLRDEVDRDLAMLGCASVDELTAELLCVCGPPTINAKARATF